MTIAWKTCRGIPSKIAIDVSVCPEPCGKGGRTVGRLRARAARHDAHRFVSRVPCIYSQIKYRILRYRIREDHGRVNPLPPLGLARAPRPLTRMRSSLPTSLIRYGFSPFMGIALPAFEGRAFAVATAEGPTRGVEPLSGLSIRATNACPDPPSYVEVAVSVFVPIEEKGRRPPPETCARVHAPLGRLTGGLDWSGPPRPTRRRSGTPGGAPPCSPWAPCSFPRPHFTHPGGVRIPRHPSR